MSLQVFNFNICVIIYICVWHPKDTFGGQGERMNINEDIGMSKLVCACTQVIHVITVVKMDHSIYFHIKF